MADSPLPLGSTDLVCHTIRTTATRSRRINARLPPSVARKVEYLEKRTHKSTSQIVVESIEHYYETLSTHTGSTAERLARAGFIGCAKGPPDLSSTYEADLAHAIEHKT